VADICSGLYGFVSLFADDLKLYTCYQLDASHNDLQTAIYRLAKWAKLWQLQLQISIPTCLAFRIINTQCRISDDVADIKYNIKVMLYFYRSGP